jgi:hypothetical protein
MKLFLIGAFVGWVCSFVYGWNRRAYYEYKEFVRGVELGKKFK